MISSTVRKAGPFAADGSTLVYPFTFKVFQSSDVVVVTTDALGVELPPLTSGFSVSLNADQENSPGGIVTFVVPLAIGQSVTLTSNLPQIQPMQITNNGGFFPAVLNNSADRLTILIQQLTERVSRALVAPISSPEPVDGLLLPNAIARAGKLVAFDALGRIVPISSSSSGPGDGGLRTDLGTTTGYQLVGGAASSVALAAPTGSGLIGWLLSTTGAVARTIFSKVGDVVSVKDFGAIGNGVADDTAAIQAALNSGGRIFFPNGTYKVSNTLSITTGVAITAGVGSAVIVTNSATNNVISITGPTAGSGAANVTIDGLQFQSSVTRTAGSYIEVSNGVYNVDISRCRFTNSFNAVRNTGVGGFGFYVRNCIFYYTININVLIDNSAPAVEMILENLNILGPAPSLADSVAGVKITCAGDITLRHVATVKSGTGLWVAPPAGLRVQLMKVIDSSFDSGTGWGVRLETNGGDIDCFKATDTWCATSSAGGGWLFSATGSGGFIRQATLVSCEGHNNALQGFRIGANNVNTTLSVCAGSNNLLEGCLVDATTTRFRIDSCTFGPTGEFIIGNGTNGIKVATGASDKYWITGNYVSGNGSTNIVDGGSGTLGVTKFVEKNL